MRSVNTRPTLATLYDTRRNLFSAHRSHKYITRDQFRYKRETQIAEFMVPEVVDEVACKWHIPKPTGNDYWYKRIYRLDSELTEIGVKYEHK